jgi:hypothetical protein
MSESKDAKKIKTIAFRLTDEDYARAESAAIASGDESPSSWCRTMVLQQAIPGYGMTENQRLFYEEIARARYLVGNGFRMLFGSEPITAATWKKIPADADQSSGIITKELLSRRRE